MKQSYSVVLTPQPEGGYTVTSPDLPDLVTEGDSREEALAMARDCAEALLLTYLAGGDPIPAPVGPAELATIELDPDELRQSLTNERVAAGA